MKTTKEIMEVSKENGIENMSGYELEIFHKQLIAESLKRMKEDIEIARDTGNKALAIANIGNEKVDNLIDTMPLSYTDCKELQGEVRKVGVKALGGKKSPAYKDNSVRGKVYADIQIQLKREFGVNRYDQIKRKNLDQALRVVRDHRLPSVLVEEVELLNMQESIY